MNPPAVLPVISVQGLSKCFHIYERPQDRLKQSLWRGRKRFFREFWAIKDVSFEIHKGESVGLIGRNGSGKSTLLQLIAGTLAPTSGNVTAGGRVAALLELGSGFNPDFTGRENVFMNGAILGLSEKEIEDRFADIVAFADIGQFIEQPVKTYSSGMFVRLAFAVAINVEPDILIVDEALAVGDMGFQLKCMERLDQLSKSGVTMLFVSHDMSTVKAFCTKAIYLVGGQVKACGTTADMVELYMLDIRETQRQSRGAEAAYKIKPSIGRSEAVAFGTDQGRISRAIFEESSHPHWACATGEEINIVVEVEFDVTVKNPSVSLVLHDHRMIDICGRYFSVTRKRLENGSFGASVKFTLRANLNNGSYFLTLRLEDRVSDDIFLPIDKQAGVLQLHVSRPAKRHFIGLFDTPIECKEF